MQRKDSIEEIQPQNQQDNSKSIFINNLKENESSYPPYPIFESKNNQIITTLAKNNSLDAAYNKIVGVSPDERDQRFVDCFDRLRFDLKDCQDFSGSNEFVNDGWLMSIAPDISDSQLQNQKDIDTVRAKCKAIADTIIKKMKDHDVEFDYHHSNNVQTGYNGVKSSPESVCIFTSQSMSLPQMQKFLEISMDNDLFDKATATKTFTVYKRALKPKAKAPEWHIEEVKLNKLNTVLDLITNHQYILNGGLHSKVDGKEYAASASTIKKDIESYLRSNPQTLDKYEKLVTSIRKEIEDKTVAGNIFTNSSLVSHFATLFKVNVNESILAKGQRDETTAQLYRNILAILGVGQAPSPEVQQQYSNSPRMGKRNSQ